MGWLKNWVSGEKSDGGSGKTTPVKLNIKTDESGKVKHVLVNESGGNPDANHTHFFEQSSGTWGSSSKGDG